MIQMKQISITFLFLTITTLSIAQELNLNSLNRLNISQKEHGRIIETYKEVNILISENDFKQSIEKSNQLASMFQSAGLKPVIPKFMQGNIHYYKQDYNNALIAYTEAQRLLNNNSTDVTTINEAVIRTQFKIENSRLAKVESLKKTKEALAKTIEEDEENNDTDGVAFAIIEKVPVYPGCENLPNNKSTKDCMSNNITEHLRNNLNTGFATGLHVNGVQKTYDQFTVASDGSIKNVRARGSQPNIEQEAIRVIQQLPNMRPGMQRDKAVDVIYALPIFFKI